MIWVSIPYVGAQDPSGKLTILDGKVHQPPNACAYLSAAPFKSLLPIFVALIKNLVLTLTRGE